MLTGQDIIDAVDDSFATRDAVALVYAAVLYYDCPADWEACNKAIIERWSGSALVYIKRRAWARVRERRSAEVN